YPSDTIDEVNKYIITKELGKDIKDYIKKHELYPYMTTSYMMGTEVLPSEDSEVNHNSKLSLLQEKRQMDIIMYAINNPEKFLSSYNKDYKTIMDNADDVYLQRIQYYLNMGYNKKEARSMAKEFIKNYIKENK